MRFLVAIPTYNRAHTLPAAIESVLAQTHRDFHLAVFDDGSTDNTAEIIKPYLLDRRVSYERFEVNKGAIAMDAYGLDLSVAKTDIHAWTHLGSDDRFEPLKLEHDNVAFSQTGAQALYGPFLVTSPAGEPLWASDAAYPDPKKSLLEHRQFVGSWANIAIRTGVLAQMKKFYGNYLPPELRHVSDVVFNARLVRFCDLVWRPGRDGVWFFGGATSTASEAVTKEQELSWQIIERENVLWKEAHAARGLGQERS